MDDSSQLTSITEDDQDRATVLYARTYAQAYAAEPSNATASRAALRAVLEAFAPQPEDAPQHDLIKAALHLASLASYSEIVGQIGTNRVEIREACDEFYRLHRPYQRLLLDAEIRLEAAIQAPTPPANS